MTRVIVAWILVETVLSNSLVRSDEEFLTKKEFENFRKIIFREVTSLKNYIRGPMVGILFEDLQNKFQNEDSRVDGDQPSGTLEQPGDGPVKMIANKVDKMSDALSNLPNVTRNVQTLERLLWKISNKVDEMSDALSNLSNVTRNVQTLQSSLRIVSNKVDGWTSAVRYLHPTITSVEGLIVGTDEGAFTFSLASLKKTRLSTNHTSGVAFDWNSKKVYWVQDGNYSIRSSNADGSDFRVVLPVITWGLAVDSTSGNIYFTDNLHRTAAIRVCSRSWEECSVVVKDRSNILNIALHLSRRLMFSTNKNSTMRANWDGTDARVIISEAATSITIDETSDRIYWIDQNRRILASSDLDGNSRTVIVNGTSGLRQGIALHEDLVYYGYLPDDSVNTVSKYGGHPVKIVRTTGNVRTFEALRFTEPRDRSN